MNNDILIEVKGVSKKFSRNLKKSLWYGLKDMTGSVTGLRSNQSELRKDEFWAVKDINFTLKRGECLGLIGRNGAGKSTLLKMLNGLIRPDEGSITMRGKVGALIAMGAGFNPLLSGRENVFVNGQVLGFDKKEIESKLDAIIDFAEIGEFIDSPVQNYSSGMKIRLGFAVAAQMEPDILLIDEVLAVGDMGFVLKCFNTIDALMEKTAVIFVSHSMPMVARICSEILLMDQGRMECHDNDVSSGIDQYYSRFNQGKRGNVYIRDDIASLVDVYMGGAKSMDDTIFFLRHLEDLKINVKIKCKQSVQNPTIGITILDKEQRPVGSCINENPLEKKNIYLQESGFDFYAFSVVIPRLNLSQGVYSITLSLGEGFRKKPVFRMQSVCQFQVYSKHSIWTPVEFEGVWK